MYAEYAIVCIGSPFGADRLGQQIAQRLAADGFDQAVPGATIHIEYLDRPGAALIDYLHGKDCVVLIDALQGKGAPGTLRRLSLDELVHDEGLSSHGLGVAEALALARALGELPACLHILGIEMAGLESGLTDEVYAQARQELLHLLR